MLLIGDIMTPADKFRSSLYVDHNEARFSHFVDIQLPLKGKSILELGAGIGDHTEFLLSLGVGEVVSIEARDENLELLKKRFDNHKKVSVVKMDLGNPSLLDRQYDVVYSYGLLYHLSNPEQALKWMSDHVSGYLILETCVSSSRDSDIVFVDEDKSNVTQSFSGQGCRPSRKWIMEKLKEFFPYFYVPTRQPRHREFPLDWKNVEEGNSLTRSIFIGSKLDFKKNKMLTTDLLDSYLPHKD